MLINKAFQFIDGQHAFGHVGDVRPVNIFAAIEEVHCLQIVAAIQGQNSLLPSHPAFGHDGFWRKVRITLFAPAFIGGECGRRFGVVCGGGFNIPVAQRHFGA
ncbi:hypothetical protein D3C71_1362220 [compost metagenome]